MHNICIYIYIYFYILYIVYIYNIYLREKTINHELCTSGDQQTLVFFSDLYSKNLWISARWGPLDMLDTKLDHK